MVKENSNSEIHIVKETEYRQKLLEQLLNGKTHFYDHLSGNFENYHSCWIAPQCAILEYLIQYILKNNNRKPEDLQPFLEIGSFTSHLSGYLSTKYNLAGFCGDLKTTIIERSFKEILPRLGLKSDNIKSVVAEASNLYFEDESLSFVFCFSSLHHFKDPVRCLKEIRRVLKPGGIFLCAHEPVQPRFRKCRIPLGSSAVKYGLIENVYTLSEYKKIISSNFNNFVILPYNDLRTPKDLKGGMKRIVSEILTILNCRKLYLLKYIIINFWGGQDFSAIVQK
ncbi:MAG: class I SAM-dependent methyltransferase [Candidatus Sumerlaeota bacterium]|nr:class I SAM-dependent methyltransferase [Candidatus Sumerlaeota bacterium]